MEPSASGLPLVMRQNGGPPKSEDFFLFGIPPYSQLHNGSHSKTSTDPAGLRSMSCWHLHRRGQCNLPAAHRDGRGCPPGAIPRIPKSKTSQSHGLIPNGGGCVKLGGPNKKKTVFCCCGFWKQPQKGSPQDMFVPERTLLGWFYSTQIV